MSALARNPAMHARSRPLAARSRSDPVEHARTHGVPDVHTHLAAPMEAARRSSLHLAHWFPPNSAARRSASADRVGRDRRPEGDRVMASLPWFPLGLIGILSWSVWFIRRT